ncbi:MAG: response regulator transcription factor [Chloroflexi bacterium]|nr:response regulator transcription factor [Chloroflexota bacterium]
MKKQLRVLIVDDQTRARQSLRALLATYNEIAVIQEAKNGLEALQRIDEYSPDVVFMDVRMPGLDGVNATQLIKQHAPRVKVIVLTMYPDYATGALASGADAFICKGDPPEKLLRTLEKITTDAPQASSGKN